MPMDDIDVAKDYQSRAADCARLLREVRHQLEHIITTTGVALGVPVEGRVKSLDSIVEKRERKAQALKSVTDFDDLIGLRVILVFQRDITAIDALIQEKFVVVERSDTSARLESNQFGYQSLHYVLRLKGEWLNVPSMAGLSQFRFELQLRTLAQHIWAVASHKLQYKREASVPAPLRRSISRVSALLETVDLEFDRVLSEREIYANDGTSHEDASLNVDTLAAVMDEMLPPANKADGVEKYDDLLKELNAHGIDSPQRLRTILIERQNTIRRKEAKRAAEAPSDDDPRGEEYAKMRYAKGVFFTHTGLVRIALDEEFGKADARQIRRNLKANGGTAGVGGGAPIAPL
jgi:Uncharacterized protein conserved in bacteria